MPADSTLAELASVEFANSVALDVLRRLRGHNGDGMFSGYNSDLRSSLILRSLLILDVHTEYWMHQVMAFSPAPSVSLLVQLQRCGVYFNLRHCQSLKYGAPVSCRHYGVDLAVLTTLAVPPPLCGDGTLLGAIGAIACGVVPARLTVAQCRAIQAACWAAGQVPSWVRELKDRGYLADKAAQRVSGRFIYIDYYSYLWFRFDVMF